MNKEMDALIVRAETEGKWLWCAYQSLWFSPRKLRAAQAQGRFRWGAVNWELRDPQDYIAEKQRAVDEATADLQRIVALVAAETGDRIVPA